MRENAAALLTREDDLDTVNGGDGKAIGRLEQGLGTDEDGGGNAVAAGGETEGGLVEASSELGRVDKGPGKKGVSQVEWRGGLWERRRRPMHCRR